MRRARIGTWDIVYSWFDMKVGGRMTCHDCVYLGFDRNEVVGMAEMCNHPENGFLVLDLLTVNMSANFQKEIWSF